MTTFTVIQFLAYLLLLLAVTKPLGAYMARVFSGERSFVSPMIVPVERLVYRLCGIRADMEQRWTQYAASLIAFSFTSLALLYLLQRLQLWLPLNPMRFGPGMTPDLAFNTAASFVTNTNWQSYGGESTLSYLVQMAGLTVQNFVSAAAGISVSIAVVRGFARQQAHTLGNFWVDLTRATLYVLLPLSLIGAVFFVSQGMIQNRDPYTQATTLEGAPQVIAQGPVASQEAIKMSAPTAADSLTQIRRILSRTHPHLPTLCK